MAKKILLVDDDAALRKTIRISLEEQGVVVTEAANGEEAIAALETALPNLVLLDLLMPVRDGYAVLNFIRERGLEVSVVIITSLSDYLDREKCLKLGAKDYIIKSDMDEENLWPRIQKYL